MTPESFKRKRRRLVTAPCGHVGRIIWRSEDGKTLAIKCLSGHTKEVKKFGAIEMVHYNPVFLVKAEDEEHG